MKLSARNALKGTVKNVQPGARSVKALREVA
jgi:molybdopterin-binding protein